MPLRFTLFTKREKKGTSRVSEISGPIQLQHQVHVTLDPSTGTLAGLPIAWADMLKSNFTREEQIANPKAVLNAVNFLQKTYEQGEERPKYLFSGVGSNSQENLLLDDLQHLDQEPRGGGSGLGSSKKRRSYHTM